MPAEDATAQERMDERMLEAQERMQKSIEALHKDFGTVRAGRASPALVDRLHVDYYGADTPLLSLANINTPEARMLVITPYDKSAINAIEKAIQKSDLALNPSNDGLVIRIVIPQLTEDRRKEMVKLVRKKAEDARVAVRNIRRDENDHLKKIDREGEVSSDQVERHTHQLQKITDRYIAVVDEAAHKKELEILEV